MNGDIPVAKTKDMILARRDVWEGYVGQVTRHGEALARAYYWASELKIWNPPIARRRPVTNTWHSTPLQPASSQGAAAPHTEKLYLYRAMTQDLKEFAAQPAASKVQMQGVDLGQSAAARLAFVIPRVSLGSGHACRHEWQPRQKLGG